MERSIFRTVQTMKKLINRKVDNMASGLPSPSKLSTRWLELFILPESGKLLKDDPTVRLLRVLGRMVRSSVLTFCVFNSIITVVGYPACIYGKSMQVSSVSDPDPVGSVSFGRIRIHFMKP